MSGAKFVLFLMLIEAKYHLNNMPSDLCDLDIAPTSHWIGVTQFALSFGGRIVNLPEPLEFPKVAAIDSDTALVVNSRAWQEKNAWVITSSGEVKASFFAGDAIQNILTSGKFLVITYFDESAVYGVGIEGNGVAIFDSNGNFGFGYKQLFGEKAVEIADCYAACWAEDNRVYFLPYTDFPLVSFDLENRTQEIWKTPENLAGSNAITAAGQTLYFHSPFRDEHGVYAWNIGDDAAAHIGSYAGNLRSLRQGRFLAVEKAGYTILSPPESNARH